MTDQIVDSLIPYDDIVQEALRAVVGRVLGEIGQAGPLPGNHHFYITFKTQAPGVAIPKHLVERFPDEMTIVLQHKFWDLSVEPDLFRVTLTFNQVAAPLLIPFSAITSFVDPAVNFALQFHVSDSDDDDDLTAEEVDNDHPSIVSEDGSNVVTVDFGKKK